MAAIYRATLDEIRRDGAESAEPTAVADADSQAVAGVENLGVRLSARRASPWLATAGLGWRRR